MGHRLSGMAELNEELFVIRTRMEKAFSPDTALPGSRGFGPSAGHCAVAATIVHIELGGDLVSAPLESESHWFNRIAVGGSLFDVDLTGDQFAYPAIRVRPASELYANTRVRSADELNDETIRRATVLARRAGFTAAVRALTSGQAKELPRR